jgi:hypothetical protein
MSKSPQHHSVNQKPQIVPKGYWTFWCALSVLGGIGGLVAAALSEEKHAVARGMVSFIWAFAWAVTYWRFRHAT